MSNPLYDKDFLKALHEHNVRTTYARITVLDRSEAPVRTIEGKVTGGSVNIDGDAAVRRTCSLTLVGDAMDVDDILFEKKNKFKLEIGLKNDIDNKYPDIIWFKQGIYLISSFSKSLTTNNLQISIQGKDKMAMLNGEMGGTLASEYRFDAMDEIDQYGNITETKIPVKDIIKNALVLQGHEFQHNIIINDLENYGYELWDYQARMPSGKSYSLYYFYSKSDTIANITTNGNMIVGGVALKDIPKENLYNRIDNFDSSVLYDGFRISKIEYGETAGYHRTELIYPSELTLKAGETITSMLDKIKNTLGNFEYYYDIDGKFIFRKKRTYTEGLLSPLLEEGGVQANIDMEEYIYKFENANILTNLSSAPALNNIKNDFSIWGVRKSASGADIPIHARYAIQRKPTKYTTLDYYSGYHACYLEVSDSNKESFGTIYDIVANGFEVRKDQNNKIGGKILKEYYYPAEKEVSIYYKKDDNYYIMNQPCYKKNKHTKMFETIDLTGSGIDQKETYYKLWAKDKSKVYYADYNCDWRELIYLMARDYFQHNEEIEFLNSIFEKNPEFIGGRTGYEQYYTDIQGFWRQIYDLNGKPDDGFITSGKYQGWHENAVYYPEQLNFWFDFLEPMSKELDKYSVDSQGDRLKTINEQSVRYLQLHKKPEVEFVIMPDEKEYLTNKGSLEALATMRIQSDFSGLFSISSRGITAAEKADELINQHICLNEQISITSLPLYFLEPNRKIKIVNKELNIDGEFVLTKYTIPLAHSGTMSLTITKILKNIK